MTFDDFLAEALNLVTPNVTLTRERLQCATASSAHVRRTDASAVGGRPFKLRTTPLPRQCTISPSPVCRQADRSALAFSPASTWQASNAELDRFAAGYPDFLARWEQAIARAIG